MTRKILFVLMVIVPLIGCVNNTDQTRFARAAARGDEVLVRRLIDKGSIDINAVNGDIGPALCLAAYGGHANIVRLLLDLGADVNVRDQKGSFPLMDAVMGQRREVIEILLERGADLSMTLNDKNGNPSELTALKLAEARGDSQTALLIKTLTKAPH